MNPAQRTTIRIELARKGWRQTDLAAKIGVRPTTLSSWLSGAYVGPPDLMKRLEAALGLPTGALAMTAESAP